MQRPRLARIRWVSTSVQIPPSRSSRLRSAERLDTPMNNATATEAPVIVVYQSLRIGSTKASDDARHQSESTVGKASAMPAS